MKLITAGVASAILTLGLAGSVAAYRTQVGEAEPVARPTAVRSAQKAPSEQPSTHVRWAPCPDRARLERGVCVTDVVRTVVVPQSAPAQASSSTPWAVATGDDRSDDESDPGEDSGGEDHDDDAYDQADDDDHGEDDHGEDDHGEDDHGEDDHGEDDD